VGGERHAPAGLSPGKTRYPLYRRVGGPQGRSGRARKISSSTGIRSKDRPARSQSVYRLSYPSARTSRYVLYWSRRAIQYVRQIKRVIHLTLKSALPLLPQSNQNSTLQLIVIHIFLLQRSIFINAERVQIDTCAETRAHLRVKCLKLSDFNETGKGIFHNYLISIFLNHLKSPVVTVQMTKINIRKVYVLPTQCIYTFYIDLKTFSDYFPIQH
jgi:hypothetical protein